MFSASMTLLNRFGLVPDEFVAKREGIPVNRYVAEQVEAQLRQGGNYVADFSGVYASHSNNDIYGMESFPIGFVSIDAINKGPAFGGIGNGPNAMVTGGGPIPIRFLLK